MARSSSPTFSICCFCSFSRVASNHSRPVSFSLIQCFAKVPSLTSRSNLPHGLPGLLGDDSRPGGVVAVLGGVADRVAHVVQAAAVDQVDDQLQLVQALEVGDLRLVAGVDQRLEAGLHQRADAAAEHGLLAEQIGLGLLREGRLDDAGAGDADAPCRRRARAARALPVAS